MRFRWNQREYRVDSLDQFSFSVIAAELAEIGVDGAVHEGAFQSNGKVAGIRFRVRSVDGDKVVCGFFDLPLAVRDSLQAMMVQRSRSPHADVLQTMSYDELALGTAQKTGIVDPPFWLARSSRNKAVATTLLIGVIVSALAWVVWLVRSQSTITVVNGVMAGNYQPIEAPRDGKLAALFVAVGTTIKPGQVVGTIALLADEREVALSRAKLVRAEADLAAYRREAKEAQATLGFAVNQLRTRRAVALAGEARAAADLKFAESKVARFVRLSSSGFVKRADLEEAVALRDRGAADVRAQRATVADIAMAEQAAAAGVVVYDDRISSPTSEVQTKVALAASLVGELRATLEQLTAKAKPENLIAPAGGTVFAIYHRPGDVLKVADDVIAISRDDVSWATGQIPGDRALYVKPGQPVEIDIPSYGITAIGVVDGIGHRALHGRDGYTADFRGEPGDVPVRIALKNVTKPLPSGLRLNMTIRLRDYTKDIRQWAASVTP